MVLNFSSERRLKDRNKARAIARLVASSPIVLNNIDKEPDAALNEALEKILSALMDRKNRRQRLDAAKRGTVLRDSLGPCFEAAINLVEEIKALKLSRASIGCGACKDGACPSSQQPGVKLNISPANSSILPEVMPEPVKQLFFRNKLCWMVEKASISELVRADWCQLVKLAKNDLKAYRKWEQEQYANGGMRIQHPEDKDLELSDHFDEIQS